MSLFRQITLDSIKNIIECFKDLPGIGEKTAERLAFSLINFDKEKLTSFSDAICDVRDKLTYCNICGNITENDICDIIERLKVFTIEKIIKGLEREAIACLQ